jgi:hypothetical protein
LLKEKIEEGRRIQELSDERLRRKRFSYSFSLKMR